MPDKKFLSYALNLSKKNLGLTAPNPVVGCVIVKNNEILASGVTAAGGRPHAEAIAIENAIKKFGAEILVDAEIYVTLEPCFHTGQTPPCVDAIIKHKFKKVVIAAVDPDLRVNGQSVIKLRQAGIEVICDESLKSQVEKINRGFFKARTQQLPFVTLKIATSLDGKIATKNFDSKWITNEKARQFAHQLRAQNDAILVGANTVRKDDPMLDCRLAGLEEFSPKRVVISRNLDFDLNTKIFQTAKEIPTLVFVAKNNPTKAEALQNLGTEVIEFDGKIRNVLQKLCKKGINNVLVEGGANVATQLLKENLIDELVWIRSGKIVGDDAIAAIGEFNLTKIADALELQKVDSIDLKSDLAEIYKVK